MLFCWNYFIVTLHFHNALTNFCCYNLHNRSRIRDLAEKEYGKVPSGDSKPNSWTLLDFGELSYMIIHKFSFIYGVRLK